MPFWIVATGLDAVVRCCPYVVSFGALTACACNPSGSVSDAGRRASTRSALRPNPPESARRCMPGGAGYVPGLSTSNDDSAWTCRERLGRVSPRSTMPPVKTGSTRLMRSVHGICRRRMHERDVRCSPIRGGSSGRSQSWEARQTLLEARSGRAAAVAWRTSRYSAVQLEASGIARRWPPPPTLRRCGRGGRAGRRSCCTRSCRSLAAFQCDQLPMGFVEDRRGRRVPNGDLIECTLGGHGQLAELGGLGGTDRADVGA